ncbi:MAG: hypothetical protein K2Z81_28360 [Cyanobacteria bacterium]|nr:hypothetical protein [Cyanobacteriota bacterium]
MDGKSWRAAGQKAALGWQSSVSISDTVKGLDSKVCLALAPHEFQCAQPGEGICFSLRPT